MSATTSYFWMILFASLNVRWQRELMLASMYGKDMIHGFLGNVGRLAAATAALRLIGEFMNARFGKQKISLKEFVYGQHAN